MAKAPSPLAPLYLIVGSAILTFSLSPLRADTVTLKSGEEYEGTVERETETELVMSVQVSGGITDEMKFDKSEVRAVVKTPADALAFEKLQKFKTGPASLTLAAYDAAIAEFASFQKKFPESAHRQEVKNEIEILKEEKARVAKKQIKWDNRWYTAAEAAANKYQLYADQYLTRARDYAARGRYIDALNICDAIQTTYPGSRAYPESVRLALSIIPHLNAEIDRLVPIAKVQQQEFEAGIVLAVEPDKSRMLQARKDEIARAEAAVAQSTANWKPFVPILEKSTEALRQTIAAEIQRLGEIKLEPVDKGLAAADHAAKEIAARNAAAAEAKLTEARQLWPENELLLRLDPALKALKEELAAAAAEAEAAAASKAAPAAPAASAAPAAPGATKTAEAAAKPPQAKK